MQQRLSVLAGEASAARLDASPVLPTSAAILSNSCLAQPLAWSASIAATTLQYQLSSAICPLIYVLLTLSDFEKHVCSCTVW